MPTVHRLGLLLGSISLLACAGCEWDGASSASPVSAREQKELPISPGGLVEELCFRGDSKTDQLYAKAANRRGRRQFRALERSLRRHPEAIVRAEITLSESPDPEIQKMTVRELAETHLEGAKSSEVLPGERPCYRRGRARLERLLSDNPN